MKEYGLIGYPLLFSASKTYFENKFESEGLNDCRFRLFPIANIEAFTDIISNPYLRGLAVTIPHKQAVIPYLNEISSEAKEIGAVNCINIRNGYTKGYNTDALGFEASLIPLLHNTHTQALVLGYGGATKAVLYVLKKLGIPSTIVSRTPSLNNMIGWEQVTPEIIQSHLLIINCTPVGMLPDADSFPPIPYEYITSNHLLYDLIYKPPLTQFLQKGEQQGAVIKNGMEMLEIQAAKNWEIWNQD